MLVAQFEGILSKLTVEDLSKLNQDMYMKFDTSPIWDTGGTKAQNIRHITKWVKGDPERIKVIVELAEKRIAEKASEPTRGPAPSTYYVSWLEFIQLPSYRLVSEAIKYRYDPRSGPKCNPVTKDGYLSVYAIYNMSAWASWKSSSLSHYEMEAANAISRLHLGDLMKLNKGRRMDQPALFPLQMFK